MDEADIAFGEGDGHAGADEPALARLEDGVLGDPQIGAGIARMGVVGRRQVGVEENDLHTHPIDGPGAIDDGRFDGSATAAATARVAVPVGTSPLVSACSAHD
jgi:hypothetical protein